ncbi:MAG TPA: ThuA domain-containing protein [Actinomycetota bacterium]|nr:ThuA domain-containing protein [Actinomycetota bacterium]
MPRWLKLGVSFAACASLGTTLLAATAPAAAQSRFDVLVFSKTAAFRHESIDEGAAALQEMASQNDFSVELSEDAAVFQDPAIDRFEVVAFLSTSGDILDESQQDGLRSFVERGGGFVGIHSASDTEYDWEWYGGLVGAYFSDHPPGILEAEVRKVDAGNPLTSSLPDPWSRADEWYNFRHNPYGEVRTLLRVDEATYEGGGLGAMHPISWCQHYAGGRSWYSSLGHPPEGYSSSELRDHLLKGVEWAAGAVTANCTPQAVRSQTSISSRAGFSGRIRSLKPACSNDRVVVLKRKVRGPDTTIARARSGNDGRWTVSTNARARSTYALLPEKRFAGSFEKEVTCRAERSRVLGERSGR